MKVITSIIGLCAITFSVAAQSEGNRPVAEYKSGKTIVTVWENEISGQYGDYIEPNFKVEKIYKKDDKWESTNYFDLEDLLKLRAAIDRAIAEHGVEKVDK
ncbi:MAG: hypothetical protein WEC59_07965 [Salibacteraceae bacterium]